MSIDTLAGRLKLAMYEAGVTQSWLALRIGVSQGAIQKLVSGKAHSSRRIVDIAKALNVNPEWLDKGIGPKKPQEKSNIPPENEWQKVGAWDESTPVDSDEVEVPFLKDIEFACGDGSFMEDDYNGFKLRFSKATLRRVGANSDGSGVLCFPVHGNSMEPIIPDGATVAVNCNDKKIVDGKIYAINQDGWKRIKTLYRTGPDQVTVRSFNSSEHPDEVYGMNAVEVIGRVFWTSIIF